MIFKKHHLFKLNLFVMTLLIISFFIFKTSSIVKAESTELLCLFSSEQSLQLGDIHEDIRLQLLSPAVDTASNTYKYGDYDLDENARVYNGIVDRGAYENQGS